jgi:protein O-GlcNAc transferase
MKANHLLPTLIAGIIAVTSVNAQDATALYNEGVKLKTDRKPAEAIVKFKKAIELKPDYYAALYDMGWCMNDTKDYLGAMQTLRKARVGWSTIPKVHFELGYAFEKSNMYDSAAVCYSKCLELKPDYSLAHKQMGYITYYKEDYAKAIPYFSSYEYYAKDSITDYLYWYRRGFSNNAVKNFAEAVPALEKAMRYKADYINTYLELGFAKSRLKKNDEAIAHYQKAISLDPKSHIGYNGIAEVYRDNFKNMDEAMNWYQKSLNLVTDERKACFGMGYCLNSKGKYSEAIAYLKKAIEKESTYTAAYVELGYSYYMTSLNSDAITNLNKAISLNPANENAHYYLALVYINKKDKAKAQEMVDALKKLSSKHVSTLQPKVDAL